MTAMSGTAINSRTPAATMPITAVGLQPSLVSALHVPAAGGAKGTEVILCWTLDVGVDVARVVDVMNDVGCTVVEEVIMDVVNRDERSR